MVYWSLIDSILTFNIMFWYDFLTCKQKTKLSHITNQAGKTIGLIQNPLSHLNECTAIRKAIPITEESSHPLHHSYKVTLTKKATHRKVR